MPSPEATFLDSFEPQFYHDVNDKAREMEPQIVQALLDDDLSPVDGEPYKIALQMIKDDLEEYQRDLADQEAA